MVFHLAWKLGTRLSPDAWEPTSESDLPTVRRLVPRSDSSSGSISKLTIDFNNGLSVPCDPLLKSGLLFSLRLNREAIVSS